jgi:cadmium resistance protein CadD (predicted permease)
MDTDLLPLLGVTIVTFIGTTLDNLLMLVVLRVSGTPRREIATGFLSGSAVTLVLCAMGTALPSVMPVQRIGLLGAIPISLGVLGLVSTLRGASPDATPSARSGVLGIATLQIASSLDTLAAFMPLFADTVFPDGYVIAGGFVLMSLAWLRASRALARSPGITRLIRPLERFARPLVLILVGLYVLSNTASDVEPDSLAMSGSGSKVPSGASGAGSYLGRFARDAGVGQDAWLLDGGRARWPVLAFLPSLTDADRAPVVAHQFDIGG